jgi:nucleoside-diphosphate-sugar epimerase
MESIESNQSNRSIHSIQSNRLPELASGQAMQIVLITGAYGFVGTNLSAYLANQGVEVWALDVAGAGTTGIYRRRFTWDGLKTLPWTQVDAVVHLAGKAHDTRRTSEAQSYFEINAGLTRRVLDAWKEGSAADAPGGGDAASGSPRRRIFILFSSVKAVADAVEGVLTEEATPAPRTPYGESKLAAEREVLKFGSSGVRESVTADGANQADNFRTIELLNFRTYILRPCMIHGPGNKGNLNLLYRVVSKGIPWPLGAFENRRSFASVGNVCAVVAGVLEGRVGPGVYQVADDEALATNELIHLMAETLGRRPRILEIPAAAIRGAARIGDWLHLPLDSERLKKLTESYVVSNEKIKRALGWTRMPVAAREGLRMTIEALR